MRHMLFAFIAMAGLALSPTALSQDEVLPIQPEVIEAIEAIEAEGAVEDEAAPDADEVEAVTPENIAEEIAEFDEAAEDAFALVDAIKSRNWPLAVGLILMLLVFVANKLGLKRLVGPKALPWVAMAVAVAGSVGTGLLAGLGWVESLLQGVLTGVAAIGGWELLLKHLLGDKKPEPPADTPTEP